MITIEKVAILRAVPFFTGIPDFILAAVAQITREIELAAGETFIREGAVEDTMYIIVDGRVRVHSQGKTIITLGAGQTVGELAVLDPEPRAASVSTLEDSLLFRLDKALFDDVMADRPEVARGVIQALCQRVREQGRLMVSAEG
jgi:CRP-like cAMP-binding protein